jgi:hypothetical protein
MALTALTSGVRIKTVTVDAPDTLGNATVTVIAEVAVGFDVVPLARVFVSDEPRNLPLEGIWNGMISDINTEAAAI